MNKEEGESESPRSRLIFFAEHYPSGWSSSTDTSQDAAQASPNQPGGQCRREMRLPHLNRVGATTGVAHLLFLNWPPQEARL